MAWRFGDLPIRTKFLITLGIPVIGLVMLIGKQVDGSIKRRNVLGYISIQSRNIELLSNAVNDLQMESALNSGYLTGLDITPQRLAFQQARTDEAIASLANLGLALEADIPAANTFAGLDVMRQRVTQRRTSAGEAQLFYRRMKDSLLGDLGRVAKLALDPETKDRLYSHLSLLHAKEALANIRSLLMRAFGRDEFTEVDLGMLNEQLSQYETNIRLFERDASPEMMTIYREVFKGPDVNLMRSIMGMVQEKRTLSGVRVVQDEWWEMGAGAMDKLRTVEGRSIAAINAATLSNLRSAQVRLFIVLVSLIGVVGAVGVMGVMIMRGIRDPVNEVTRAASALALGDVSAHVQVGTNDEVGQMARSFNGMIDHIRSLAASAENIGRGNYDTGVDVRGDQDVLGSALTRMKENLKAARLRDMEQNRALQQEKEKLEHAHRRIQVLIREIHHRVKNNMQVVASMLRLQSGSIDDERLQHVFDQSQSRVQSMALIHEKLYKGDELAQLDLALYIEELFAALVQMNNVGDEIRHRTRVDPGLAFDLNTMVPLGLVLNEMITNSFKHAFKGRSRGGIDLDIRRAGPAEYDLMYSDDGVGLPLNKQQGGDATLGMSLIESLVEQLNGHMTVEGGPRGTRYHIRFKTR